MGAHLVDSHNIECTDCGATAKIDVLSCGCQKVRISNDENIDPQTGHKRDCRTSFPEFLKFGRDLAKDPARNGEPKHEQADNVPFVVASNLVQCKECGGVAILQILSCGCIESVFPYEGKPIRRTKEFARAGHHQDCASCKPEFLRFDHFFNSH